MRGQRVLLETAGLRPLLRGGARFGMGRVAAIGPFHFYQEGSRRSRTLRLKEGYYWGTLPQDARVLRVNDDSGNGTVWFLLPGDPGFEDPEAGKEVR